ncbi:MAG TPA: TolC family protein, partial [Candidatus Ozemobacteraceae bacterium]|nr:TolC family protein [Candidatus Ozemobacteraceae bacterium]
VSIELAAQTVLGAAKTVQTSRTRSSLNTTRHQMLNHRVDIESVLACVGTTTLDISIPATPTFELASMTLAAATDLMLARDFDLALIANDAAIFRKGIHAARQANLPTLDINSNYTYGHKVGTMKDTRDYTVTFGLSFPVYDGGDIRNEVRKAEKTLAELELAHEDLVNRKRALLTTYFNDYHEAVERIAVAAKAMEQSRENMRMVMTRYEHGAASIVELVDAQLTLSSTSEEAVDARIDERLRLADILLAIHDLEALCTLDKVPGDTP